MDEFSQRKTRENRWQGLTFFVYVICHWSSILSSSSIASLSVPFWSRSEVGSRWGTRIATTCFAESKLRHGTTKRNHEARPCQQQICALKQVSSLKHQPTTRAPKENTRYANGPDGWFLGLLRVFEDCSNTFASLDGFWWIFFQRSPFPLSLAHLAHWGWIIQKASSLVLQYIFTRVYQATTSWPTKTIITKLESQATRADGARWSPGRAPGLFESGVTRRLQAAKSNWSKGKPQIPHTQSSHPYILKPIKIDSSVACRSQKPILTQDVVAADGFHGIFLWLRFACCGILLWISQAWKAGFLCFSFGLKSRFLWNSRLWKETSWWILRSEFCKIKRRNVLFAKMSLPKRKRHLEQPNQKRATTKFVHESVWEKPCPTYQQCNIKRCRT